MDIALCCGIGIKNQLESNTCRIRNYISTARKQGWHIWDAILFPAQSENLG